MALPEQQSRSHGRGNAIHKQLPKGIACLPFRPEQPPDVLEVGIPHSYGRSHLGAGRCQSQRMSRLLHERGDRRNTNESARAPISHSPTTPAGNTHRSPG